MRTTHCDICKDELIEYKPEGFFSIYVTDRVTITIKRKRRKKTMQICEDCRRKVTNFITKLKREAKK